MSLKPIRYPLDKTGKSPDNLVVNEIHELKPTKIRALVPTYGGFFTNSLVVTDVATNLVLERGTQYKLDNLFEMATQDTGLEVAGVIVITDSNVSNRVSITYQCIGGLYGYSVDAVIQQIESLKLDNRPIEWGNIANKPATYPPAPHLQDIGDIYGFEYIVHALQQLRHAILTGDEGSHTVIYEYIDSLAKGVREIAQEVKTLMDTHLRDYNNPHRVTVEQIGAASLTWTREQVRQLANGISAHNNLRNNPHQVTARQVGSYTTTQVDDKFKSLETSLLSGTRAHLRDYNNPHRVTAAQVGAYTKNEANIKINQAVAKTDTHANRRDNPHRVTAAQVGSYTKAEVDSKINSGGASLASHITNYRNPHRVTSEQVGTYTKGAIDSKINALDHMFRASAQNLNETINKFYSNGTTIKPTAVPISPDAGNKLSRRNNGLYVSGDSSNIYVSGGKIFVKVGGLTKQIWPAQWADYTS